VWEARDWPERTRFFPWAIGIPVLALAVCQLFLNLWRAFRPPVKPEANAIHGEPDDAKTPEMAVDARTLRQRTLTISVWAVVFALGLWLFGFKVGGLFLSLVFLRFQAHESWRMSVLYAVGIYLFFFAGLEMALAFPLPAGALATWLGLQSFDSYVVNPILSLVGL